MLCRRLYRIPSINGTAVMVQCCHHCAVFTLVAWTYVVLDKQGFIESVTELVKVKSEVHKLMIKVESANKVIQDSGREVCMRKREFSDKPSFSGCDVNN